ncbi:YhcN/YlaJ family sporulation lipoprotein [Croceifilum oryzae]|uniref:YhcN/YlaJ family sporulation lipoprotein n=1 Tax=Croceifilum oryzae TaxID=1553429 RepID=A0AAJ1TGZ0_9BACL|nr:YhcN/YlaJ family sporulation lipoprotein [Croceifilum oryzae]MDQ0416357.1 YhcN/YlaJ family sporulation lipoprotein [Croceifilum oryzae]
MKRKTFQLISSFTITALFITVATGCNQDNKPPSNNASPKAQNISYQQTAPDTSLPAKRSKVKNDSDHLVQLAKQVPQVKEASAILLGKYAVVAIDVNPDLDSARVGTVKYAVAQALRDDPKGKSALVTADVDLLHRIKKMNEEISQGRPIAGIMSELGSIVARIAPQPSNEVKKRERDETKQDRKDTH